MKSVWVTKHFPVSQWARHHVSPLAGQDGQYHIDLKLEKYKLKLITSSLPHLMGVEKLIVISSFHLSDGFQFLAVQFINLPEIPGTKFLLHSSSELCEKVPDVRLWVSDTTITGAVKSPGVQEKPEVWELGKVMCDVQWCRYSDLCWGSERKLLSPI